ncbi:MAG: hypothetical protein AAGC63_09940, partial [Propionicimonas sp.]
MTIHPTRPFRWLAAATGLALLTSGCMEVNAGAGPPAATPPAASGDTVLGDDVVEPLLDRIVQRTPTLVATPRLAEGLVPPTNRWYSGLVFGDQPQPVFPLPLSFALTADGFGFGLPRVTATADTIAGGYAADVQVGLGATRSVVSSDDPSVVAIDALAADGSLLGRTTLAQGSPFVSWVAATAGTVTVLTGFQPSGDNLYVATVSGTRYALATTGATLTGSSVQVDAGGSLVFWPVPEGRDPGELVAL